MNKPYARPGAFMRSLGTSARACFTTLLLATVPVAGFAQETTGTIQGTVTDDSGNGVAGASITATHLPTGVSRTTQTTSSGNYRIPSLRVGGPYVVELAGTSSYGGERIEEISVGLGDPYLLNLVTRTTAIEEIVVSAQQQDTILQMGAGSSFDQRNITGMANVNRDFKNIIRQNPLVTIDPTNDDAISVAGMNNRFNSMTVDGVKQNDDFGLNNSGFPTQRSPISIDAIEQVVVAVAPFDVSYGGFTGANINAVTKSGTNEWDGSFAYYHTNQSLIGDKTGDDNIDLGDFDRDTLVATIGGPIIKDKVWFFAAYDEYKASDTSALEFGPEGSGRPNEISGVTQEEVDDVIRISDEIYGFDAGALPSSGSDIEDKKILVKLDWAITDNHQATLTYQDVTGNALNPQGSSDSSNRLGLASNWYDKKEDMETISAQLFSSWTDTFSTEIKVARKKVDTFQESLNGTDYAQMTIDTPSGGSIRVGPDIFRHANKLQNEQTQLKIGGEYLLSNHTLSAGYERDEFDVFNVFVFQSEAEYNFDSITDYEARVADEFVGYRNAFTNEETDGAASFAFAVNSVYLQDIWDVNESLTLQYGLRYDFYTGSDRPDENPGFEQRNGFSNTENLDGRSVVMPRLGFTYDFDNGTRLRGGVGLFSGGNPNVWISNSFTNDGQTIVSPDFGGNIEPNCTDIDLSPAVLTNVDAFNVPTPVQNCMFPGAGDVEATDPDFDIPSTWRVNLAIEQDFDLGFLGEDWFLSFETVISRANKAVEWQELRRSFVGDAPDGRPIYDRPPNYDVILTNIEEGSTDTYTFAAAKTWDTRAGIWDFSIAYTRMNAKDVNPSQSSTVSSNYGRPATFDRNGRTLVTSDFQVKNRVNGTFGWTKDLFGDNETRISGYYEFRSGHPYSYTMREGEFDEAVWGGHSAFARRDSQLMYVPTLGDTNVIFNNTTGATTNDPTVEAAFNAFIAGAGLEGYRGKIMPRNHDVSDDRSRIDLRIAQEIGIASLPGVGDTRLRLFMDIENLGNLLNNNWGRVEQVNFPFNFTAVDMVSINDNGQYVYGSFDNFEDGVDPFSLQNGGLPSLWKVQFGIKIEF